MVPQLQIIAITSLYRYDGCCFSIRAVVAANGQTQRAVILRGAHGGFSYTHQDVAENSDFSEVFGQDSEHMILTWFIQH